MKIALIACCKQKQHYPTEARYLYMSSLFTKTLKYVESNDFDDYYILSAKYGLVNKYQQVEPYDLSLNNVVDKSSWYKEVSDKINSIIIPNSDLHLFAGKLYYSGLNLTSYNVIYPFGNMGIGQRLKFLNSKICG